MHDAAGHRRGALPRVPRRFCFVLLVERAHAEVVSERVAKMGAARDVTLTRFDVAVLPWGATEAHNYHLPHNTDVAECDYIDAESTRKAWDEGTKVIVLPTIPFGINTGQLDVKLDMNLYPSTQMAIPDEVVDVVSRTEIRKLVVLNGHGGNDFKQMIREIGARYPEIFVCQIHWFRIMDLDVYFEEPGDHAGEMETSVMIQ
ncbi:MAG: creatininase family protein [Rhodothermales bacterium]